MLAGSMRLKRLLSRDDDDGGGGGKKRRITNAGKEQKAELPSLSKGASTMGVGLGSGQTMVFDE